MNNYNLYDDANKIIFQQEILDKRHIEDKIVEIVSCKYLDGDKHTFFINAQHLRRSKENKSIAPVLAFELAKLWEIITKTFMFTTFQSLAKLSESLEQSNDPIEPYLVAFQTGLQVIADDINNHHSAFSKVAPKGICGIHYKWWHNDIVVPLANKLNIDANRSFPLTTNVQALIAGMRILANNPMGFSIQLRIVEDIALHIAVAFSSIYSSVLDDAQNKIFNREDLSWITSHIKAEVSHRNQVTDHEKGMTYIITCEAEQNQFLENVEWYASLWEKALNDFNLVFQPKIDLM